ncbi:Xaa-Pro aminopeptidase [Devosia yakushimensis]|uniref:Xaa-Pro aminopeptidase n=1 Tax=Devosia yakushimensis TaxID=470028 RepID=A0ABQ5UA46_9HYPH|nr:aminopeptidase P family protein [Devosia yakushimensis]GLQ08109.1 Xaa-Pro aminopeptidase [Devosia yakushimensis]
MPNAPSRTESVLRQLREKLAAAGLYGLVVPRFDPYQGEVVAPHDERLAFLTGFSGSAGIAAVTADHAVLFVDGRYQVQVRSEVDTSRFEIAHFFDFPIEAWLEQKLPPGQRIGINPMLVPSALYGKLETAMSRTGGELVLLETDLIDAIWPDQPPPPLSPIRAFPLRWAGEDSVSKRGRIGAAVERSGADFLVETQPDNIAWLLNIRGGDIAHTPIAHSTAIVGRDGRVDWFVDERKLPNDRSDIEAEGLVMQPADGLIAAVRERAAGKAVLVDPGFAPVAVRLAVEAGGGKPLLQFSPVTLAKAIKNAVELAGFRQAHLQDGVAWTEFLAWLDAEVPARLASGNPITELEAQAQLLDFRRAGMDFVEDSFGAISASGSNAAMCHYSSKPETNAPLTGELPYLIDSGGQYWGGTTDATRTMSFGPANAAVRQTYTAVLKGFVALMTAQFPPTAQGHHLDALARRPLWDIGLDYDHGTGHGVGHFLSVHEHPHRFGKAVNAFGFEPGVVMTIEPGYYREGAFGLRVENQVEVVAGAAGFLRFETLTLVPIDLRLADISTLTAAEIAFLDDYHVRVRKALTGRLSPRAAAFLERSTAPIATNPAKAIR